MAKQFASPAKGLLAKYFPNIRSREEILQSIHSRQDLEEIFQSWNPKEREKFLDYCTGVRGMKVLYDGIFKEIFNPEVTPERLEELLSLLFRKEVKIKQILPNDSTRLGAESSLICTDMIVQQSDGSLSNVEIQKIGYAFPGQRCACYSSDHLLRQYKQVRGKKGESFNYWDIKNVHTIVFFEKSPREFHGFPDQWLHVFRQQSNTGLVLPLLQEYYFIPLDIFRKTMENKAIGEGLEAWLAFLSFDEPSRIEELISRHPKFKALYEDIYNICRNMEDVMGIYSKELEILDHNTVLYMIDEMQEEINKSKEKLEQMDEQLEQKGVQLEQKDVQLEQKDAQLEQKDAQLEQKDAQLEQKDVQLEQKDAQLEQKDAQLEQMNAQLNRQAEQIRQLQIQLSALQDRG